MHVKKVTEKCIVPEVYEVRDVGQTELNHHLQGV